MKSWPSKFSPEMAKNHWPGSMVLVSVEMIPGGPHFLILPFTASAILDTDQMGGFTESYGVIWELQFVGFKVLLMAVTLRNLFDLGYKSTCFKLANGR